MLNILGYGLMASGLAIAIVTAIDSMDHQWFYAGAAAISLGAFFLIMNGRRKRACRSEHKPVSSANSKSARQRRSTGGEHETDGNGSGSGDGD